MQQEMFSGMYSLLKMIPYQILDKTFGKSGVLNDRGYKTIKNCIFEKVWREFVFPTFRFGIGRRVIIPLQPDWAKEGLDTYGITGGMGGINYTMYHVPEEARDGMDIMQIGAVQYTNGAYGMYGNSGMWAMGGGGDGGNTVETLLAASIESRMLSGSTIIPKGELQPGNQIKIYPVQEMGSPSLSVVCWLSYNPELTSADSTQGLAFAKLLLCATKVVCYNSLDLLINEGEMVSGTTFNRLTERVREYSTAEAEYMLLLGEAIENTQNDPINNMQILKYIL